MTTHSKEFDADWPNVLEDMTVYLEDMLPPGGRGKPKVTLDLSSRLVPLVNTRPWLDDWLDEWRGNGVDITWNPVAEACHTLRIEVGAKGGFWRGVLGALGLVSDEASPAVKTKDWEKKPQPVGYQRIEEAIGQEILYFLQTEGEAQRQYMPDYAYVLKSVELRPLSAEADALLEKLLNQPAAMRQGLLQKQLKRQMQRHQAKLSLDSQCRFERLADGDRTDGEIALAMRRTTRDSDYLVFLDGEWEAHRVEPPPVAGPVLRFEVFDRAGLPRVVELSGAETLIGREGRLRVDGTFASRRHCLLRVGDAWATLEDLNSAHGTYVDGQRLVPGQPLPVHGMLDIRLGIAEGDYADYPRIRVTLPSAEALAGLATPIARPSAAQATPIVGQPAAPTLAELHVHDEAGRRVLPVRKTPFLVGRDPDCDAVISEANTGVSRKHFSIESFAETGANIRMAGSNGAALAGIPVNRGEMLWPWDMPMELAIDVKSQYPTPVLILKRPA